MPSADESEVTELRQTELRSTDSAEQAAEKAEKRRQLFAKIRNQGNFMHNQKVIKEGGKDTVVRTEKASSGFRR